MKKAITSVMAFGVVLALAAGAYAQTSVDVSVDFNGGADIDTSFAVYTDAAGTVPVGSAIELDNNGYIIVDDHRYVAGKLYADITEGNYGRWYLGVYTSNEAAGYDTNDPADDYNAPNGSDLFIDELDELGNKLERSLIWKYRNSVLFGTSPQSVGDEIDNDTLWSNPNASEWKYFINIDPTPVDSDRSGVFADLTDMTNEWDGSAAYASTADMLATLEFASLAMYAWNFDSSVLAEIVIGIDTGSSDRKGTYKSTLNFEVYYR